MRVFVKQLKKLMNRRSTKRLRRMLRRGLPHSSRTSGLRRRMPLKISWKRKNQHRREIENEPVQAR